ncbi:hypothetical protein J4G48_0038080 [Bradyrhizobium barranii subsp. apii]|uniref:hypothetical protein n=1 Tax=Bradyrhizobium barranii TaxID=2992140 RepID=UPI001AA10DBB|nr:hypothetical protein [Bradyrhizobium barranii]UPT95001.1 hypothetical protein J4G48_0038080 [Bradyrhizobium barranii subsp. apii]
MSEEVTNDATKIDGKNRAGGNYLYQGGFCILAGKYDEFAKWCKKNGQGLKKACPMGIEFVGIFMVRQTSEKEAGDYRIVWRLDNYASLDTFQTATQPAGPLHQLLTELGSFSDRGANWSQIMMQDMENVVSGLFYD